LKRDIEKDLKQWKLETNRLPLLLRGARQTGKTYIIEKFGNENFKNIVTVNFEFQREISRCFEKLDPADIINNLQLILNVNIIPGETLLFLDEIQECPDAIMSLRYFREKMPDLHVIGAGSLLEFALNEKNFRMPVGRVQFLYLKPLSFSEFLDALDDGRLRSYLSKINLNDPVDEAIHDQLIELVRKYFILGGMPAVLSEYIHSKDMKKCQNILSGILETYRSDFGKYAKNVQHKYLHKLFDAAPRIVGQRFKFVNVDPLIRSRELKNALDLLVLSGVINPVYASSSSGLPLGAQINEQKFKLIFLDIGLVQNACGLQAEISIQKDVLQINSGLIAEQFVGQELMAYSDKYKRDNLYFWTREQRSSSAEVDFVVSINSKIFPVEVKSGKTGTLRSLKLFLTEKKAFLGIRISRNALSYHDDVLSVPLYMIEQLSRLVEEI